MCTRAAFFLLSIRNNALDDLMGRIKVGGKMIIKLRYADDLALIAGDMKELQELVDRVKEASIQFGLSLKICKKYFQINNGREYITINDDEYITNVNEFVYLGPLIIMTILKKSDDCHC